MNAATVQRLAATMRARLWQTATVYAEAPDGTFSTVVRSGLACRLTQEAPRPTAPERAEAAGGHLLYYDPTYTMPRDVQLDISGRRHTVINGTVDTWTGPDGTVAYHRCEVIEAL